MRKVPILVSAVFALSLLASVQSGAKPNYRKELGLKSCTECHNEDLKAKTDKPLYLVAKKMREKLRKQEGSFEGKISCWDCHEGDPLR